MDLLLVGTSHHLAPVAVRERWVAAMGDLGGWLSSVARPERTVAELLVVSTCHRLEFYLATTDAVAGRACVARWCGVSPEDLEGEAAWFVRTGAEAAEHLCRVAAGLDSLIVGEAEIAGQVRRAAAVAREAGTIGPHLEPIVAGALRASGRARSETRISEGVLSAASAGVALATGTLGSLAHCHVLVVGAGQAGRTMLARLARTPLGRLSVASRSHRHATDAASAVGAEVWTIDEIGDRLHDVDVVLAAIQGQHWVMTAGTCRRAFEREPERLRVLVDLSMPRAIEPAVGALRGVRLFSVDDLGDLARQSARRRAREVPVVEAIARDEARRAYARLQARRRYERTRH